MNRERHTQRQLRERETETERDRDRDRDRQTDRQAKGRITRLSLLTQSYKLNNVFRLLRV